MSEWSSYPKNRKICHKNGYSLIIPDNCENKSMPLFCDICEISFSNKEDEKTYKTFGCCSACADTWVYSHKTEWQNGWRPDKDKIEKAVKKRFFINPHIVFE